MKCLVVVPAYNEEVSLAATLDELDQLPAHFDIVVIDDGSDDATSRVAHGVKLRPERSVDVVRLSENCGIGAAVQTGYLFAEQRGGYRYVIQCDADGQHEVAAIEALTRVCDERELDLCVGSRFLTDDPDGFRSTLARRVGIRFLSRLVSVLSGRVVTDPTSGLRCAGPRAWRRFAAQYPDDYPEPESLYWCLRSGLRVGETPVRMRERRGGQSSINPTASLYYMAKVTLAILVDRLRRREVAAL